MSTAVFVGSSAPPWTSAVLAGKQGQLTRALCAPHYGARGGRCYDPASLILLEVATKVDQYDDYAQFCRDLHDRDKGRRYRQLAGLHEHVPGEDDLSHFRDRIGDAVVDQITAVAVDFLYHFGLIKGELLSTDGQLEPSYSRYQGCTYACQDCQGFALSEADRQALGEQLRSGAKRLQLTCPFPEVVEKVRQASAKKAYIRDTGENRSQSAAHRKTMSCKY
jgi:hypothetical protein